MTLRASRAWLLGIFLVFLSLQIVALLCAGSIMWPEEQESLIVKCLTVYSVHLGVMLGAIFAKPKAGRAHTTRFIAFTGITLTLIWNLVLVWRTISFAVFQHDKVADLLKYLDSVSSASNFLVAGALAFFFTHENSR
jgi:hypothetical protein